MEQPLPPITVRRYPERGRYDAQTIHEIIDAAPYCHVAVVKDNMPLILPTFHVRIGSEIFLHGAVANGLFKALESKAPVAVAMTLLDGWVLARSWFNHSANYRSVVIFGRAREVHDLDEKRAVFRAFADKVVPGRWDDARQPNAAELRTTRMFAIPIDHASAKIRSGPPEDTPEDLLRPTWAGVVPVAQVLGAPEPDQAASAASPLPPYLLAWIRQHQPR
ncbi:MAG: pyridoxamine 5'-phosphate oxidase family protein [Firmicutes bacterium]|nr:pyridoxamine 5'-phosphate oxidase family protein [Bacillota bacterium]